MTRSTPAILLYSHFMPCFITFCKDVCLLFDAAGAGKGLLDRAQGMLEMAVGYARDGICPRAPKYALYHFQTPSPGVCYVITMPTPRIRHFCILGFMRQCPHFRYPHTHTPSIHPPLYPSVSLAVLCVKKRNRLLHALPTLSHKSYFRRVQNPVRISINKMEKELAGSSLAESAGTTYATSRYRLSPE